MPVANIPKKHGTVITGISELLGFEKLIDKNAANGYCPLDASKLVPLANLPDLSGLYLPLTGGTLTGDLRITGSNLYIDQGYIISLDHINPAFIEANSSGELLFTDTDVTYVKLKTLDSFIGNLDTPASYTGNGTKHLRVNAGETAVEFSNTDIGSGFFRRFMQWEGFDVQGTWTWATNANVTNWASVRAEAAGYWHNTSHANGDEYEYIGLFLGPGNYSIDIWYTTDADHGKVDIYYGLTFITTLDQYTAVPGYNGHPSPINFSLTVETSANLTFTVNGKNAASSDFYVDWQRFEITKTG